MDGRLAAWIAAACCAIAMPGCGDASTSPTSVASDNQAVPGGGTVAASASLDLSSPERAIYAFLEAVRKGDVETSRAILTPLALQKLEEYKLPFLPQGSNTASFEVYQATVVEGNRAEVETVWTDLDENGKPLPEPTRWMLRSIDGRWRVAGMTAQSGQEGPIVLDFEHPEELMRQFGLIEEPPSPPAATDRQAQQQDPFQGSPRPR